MFVQKLFNLRLKLIIKHGLFGVLNKPILYCNNNGYQYVCFKSGKLTWIPGGSIYRTLPLPMQTKLNISNSLYLWKNCNNCSCLDKNNKVPFNQNNIL